MNNDIDIINNKKVQDIILWHRIGCISVILAKQLDVSPTRAMQIFYDSEVYDRFVDKSSMLYIFNDYYIADEVIISLKINK
ncbi:MAG: DUF3791 domain-containing protein [Bacteroidales bacterium]|nr:DUF3791 domain-containing protein [Bacteroidales bacterium]